MQSLQIYLTDNPLYTSQIKDYEVLLETHRKELAVLEEKMKQRGALTEPDRMNEDRRNEKTI